MDHPLPLAESHESGTEVLTRLPSEELALREAAVGPGGLIRKIERNWQDYGWRITLQKTLAYLFRFLYFQQVYRLYRIDLDDARPPENLTGHHFTFKSLTAQNVEMIAQVEAIAEWMQGRLKDAIANGQLCLVALDGDKVAGFNLINFSQATLILVNLTRKLRKNMAWSEHIAVKRQYRKTGLGSQLRLRIFQELKTRGIRRLYGGTLQSNFASQNLARSVGFTFICDISYRKILALQRWRYKRVRGSAAG
jgi:GNAT superfamily N-acetyltransferase